MKYKNKQCHDIKADIVVFLINHIVYHPLGLL